MRPVEILASQGDRTALRAGVVAGETVATDGIERLRPGAKVTIPGSEPQQAGKDKKEGKEGKDAKAPTSVGAPKPKGQGQAKS
jgi:hypothetical protein